MATILIIGFLLGAISSVPMGPLGAYMINKMNRDGFKAGLSVGLTAAFFDAFYSAISLFGIIIVIGTPLLNLSIQLIGLIVLLLVGGRNIFLHKEELSDFKNSGCNKFTERISKYLPLFEGNIVAVIYNISNPTILAFWLNVANVLHGSVLKYSGPSEYVFFSLSVGLGSVVCQYSALSIIQKIHNVNEKSRIYIRWVNASIFGIAIMYFGIQIVKEFVKNFI